MPKYLSKVECLKEIKREYVAKLGYISKESPFIVPITYFYDEKENSIIAFSTFGHKIESMREKAAVCLYLDKIVSVKEWKTILIHGEYEELDKIDHEFYLEKLGQGVKDILNIKDQKNTREMEEFSNVKFLKGDPIVFQIKIWDITGRFMG
ncbi:pyridoxamine 5'-phosphate oxidase family protein [Pareuzebyella sediminis]|uniref:pyridoxamine 5'-phosphate oxidase family protein n=1 Tax=Pareuzebyella sediminis TaxID=2607998 RepID=UPI0011EE196C|nr:pyridoxamine 5'-phosphate oxidase family protein [Pareuzebyella sediminis]